MGEGFHIIGPKAATHRCQTVVDSHDEVRAHEYARGLTDVVRRATANHWVLVRTPEGWRASRRTSRVLDGRTESPALLAAGARGDEAPVAD